MEPAGVAALLFIAVGKVCGHVRFWRLAGSPALTGCKMEVRRSFEGGEMPIRQPDLRSYSVNCGGVFARSGPAAVWCDSGVAPC